ncbi:prepilin-type N-terminal cleavage/methylation domain-containing protein [Thalassoglobus polymorphus]|nr:prepilin-type N-terminal cleavage/methylation domain-containing protein [Thalassoglobus polymorphus]
MMSFEKQTNTRPRLRTQSGPDEKRWNQNRDGFSLVEVLIALALTVLLLSAVYSAVGLHLRFQTAGRDQVNKSQLMRALIRKMDEDFGSIVLYVEQADEEEPDESSVENLEPLDDVSDTALTIGGLESESAPITFGVVGTSEFVHLCVSRPLRDLSYDSIYTESPSSGRSNDLLTVTYGLAPVDVSMLIDPRKPKYDVRDDSMFDGRPETGFGRRSIDLYAFDSATDFLDSEHVLATEISEVQFSYFDGTAWLASWDSREIGGLPRAVKVTFGIWQQPAKTSQKGYQYSGTGTVFNVEHVFHIPLAIPLME